MEVEHFAFLHVDNQHLSFPFTSQQAKTLHEGVLGDGRVRKAKRRFASIGRCVNELFVMLVLKVDFMNARLTEMADDTILQAGVLVLAVFCL